MTSRFIDLNADMGEYADDAQRASEAALMPLISSCSVACGGHAGDTTTMRETLRLAKTHNVSIGAHPAYPDREGFGRRHLIFDADILASSIHDQIAALEDIAAAENVLIRHVKPHGALYNDAAKDIDLATIIARAAKKYILVGQPGSALEQAARDEKLAFAPEGFVDRAYQSTGALTPRSQPGAIIADIDARAEQALAIARSDTIQASDGELSLNVKTLCIHSDSPGAVETAKAARRILEENDFTIRAFE